MEKFATMEGISRMRNPRAFANNKVGVYDLFLGKANLLIQKQNREHIRMVFWTSSASSFIVISDSGFFVLDRSVQNIERVIKIKDILNVLIQEKQIILKTKDESYSFECESTKAAKDSVIFLNSQRMMYSCFGTSLLEDFGKNIY